MVNRSAVAETLQPKPSREVHAGSIMRLLGIVEDRRCNWMLDVLYLLVRKDHVIQRLLVLTESNLERARNMFER